MALISCKACGKEISRNAKACPHCGEPPPKRTGLVTWLIVGLLGYAAVQCSSTMNTTSRPTSPEREAERERERKAEQFLTDARIDCQFAIRKFLKDPESAKYEDEHTAPVLVKGNQVTVTMLVRAKNSMNAIVPQRFRCEGEIVGEKLFMRKVIGL
jgi:hypothetical protein